MNTPHTITITNYNYDTKQSEVVVEDLSIHLLSKSIEVEHLAGLLDGFLNSYGNQFKQGEKVGTLFMETHRTLQGCFVNFLLGCLVGIAKTEYTDPRNEKAIFTAQAVARLVIEGKLHLQPFI